MTRLFITRPLPDPVIAAARTAYDVVVRSQTGPLTRDELIAALSDYDVVLPTLGDMFSAEIFSAVPNPRCKLLANFGVGYNHIDVASARAAGIAVSNTPGAVTDSTADVALTLMLMSARRAGEGERMVRAGNWTGWHPTQMLGLHLSGKCLGIIGMGRIGQAIAKRAHFGFGMEIVFHNRSAKSGLAVPATQLDSIAAVMGRADVVVLAVPGGAETRHLIGATELAAMQPHGHIINIARGDILEETALIDALEQGQIAGAGLDVYEHEPVVSDRLRAIENVVLLPHLGTSALEVRQAMGMMALDNIRAFAAGDPLPNPV
jgi:lactate dehydrogenase-like 2-hydroxyacid dehydrogenase